MNADGKDEKVDGPKIAAEIIERMRPENKKKLLEKIQRTDPSIAEKIEANLYDFDQIAELTPQSIQLLIKEISPQDMLLSMKVASEAVKNVLLQNLSERRRTVVTSELAALPPTRLSEIEAAKRRIIQKLDELRTKGLVRGQSKHDVWV